MGVVYLPAHRVLSVSAPPGEVSLFASAWRLRFTDPAQYQLSFHLEDGNTLRATVNAGTAATELWGNEQAIWFDGASALTLLPPLQPAAAAAGIPLPI
jgi:hypothetical protein